eukprot:8570040-Lingulodinium_polyedra.AAC.1
MAGVRRVGRTNTGAMALRRAPRPTHHRVPETRSGTAKTPQGVDGEQGGTPGPRSRGGVRNRSSGQP